MGYIAPVKKNNITEVNYLAELVFPSKSAYSIHVMKMCDELAKRGINTNLYLLNKEKNLNFFNYYNCIKKFKINNFEIKKNNFLGRIFFSYKLVKLIVPKKNSLVISRSIISAILLNFFKNNVILELHHELTGFTKYFFLFYKNFSSFKNLKIIFITKNLSKFYNLKDNKSIILDDGVDIINFRFKKDYKIFKNTCVYTGSFAKGKGIENIIDISRYNQNIFFHLYGDFTNSNFSKDSFKNFKNIKYMGYIKYKNIPKVLSKYNILLLPYSNKVFVRSKSIETSKYMSPLKLFDYMASKKIIFASKMNVYRHILNKKNSILINSHSPKEWADKLENTFNNLDKYKLLRNNAYEIVKKYTWKKRVNKIIEFANIKKPLI